MWVSEWPDLSDVTGVGAPQTRYLTLSQLGVDTTLLLAAILPFYFIFCVSTFSILI